MFILWSDSNEYCLLIFFKFRIRRSIFSYNGSGSVNHVEELHFRFGLSSVFSLFRSKCFFLPLNYITFLPYHCLDMVFVSS